MDLEFNSLQWYPDNIQLLYRDELYNADTFEHNVVEIITVKNVLNQCYTTKLPYLCGKYLRQYRIIQ